MDGFRAEGAANAVFRVWKAHTFYRSRGEHSMQKLQKWRILREFPCSVNMFRPCLVVIAQVINMRLRRRPPYPGIHKPVPAHW